MFFPVFNIDWKSCPTGHKQNDAFDSHSEFFENCLCVEGGGRPCSGLWVTFSMYSQPGYTSVHEHTVQVLSSCKCLVENLLGLSLERKTYT